MSRIDAFIEKYRSQLRHDFDPTKVKCAIIDDLSVAGTPCDFTTAQLLREGELVAFPTETVYGLGANALNANAVRSIFATKRRPLTDPVIVHLHDAALIEQYVDDTTHVALGRAFWPGPFTLVLPYHQPPQYIRAPKLATCELLSASTGSVGFRVPGSDVALRLLELSGIPIAAPSANVFAHVSPTAPIHVFNDFYDQRVFIIDGPICVNGIESTVVKIDDSVRVLRRGSLSLNKLVHVVQSLPQYQGYACTVVQRVLSEVESSEAPGAMLKHYAPLIPTYILRNGPGGSTQAKGEVVIIEFGPSTQRQNTVVRNLSVEGDYLEAMHNFYECLRWAENQPAVAIFIQEIDEHPDAETLRDKIYRAASGEYVYFHDGSFYY